MVGCRIPLVVIVLLSNLSITFCVDESEYGGELLI